MTAGNVKKNCVGFVTMLVMLGLAATIACNGTPGQSTGSTSSAANGALVFAGCYAPNASTGNVDCGLATTFGNPTYDAAVQAETTNQSQFWSGIPANVHPWNDCSGANALSLPSGDILYGVNLLEQLVTTYGGDGAPISGVLAHEWGHQIQFNNGWFTSSEPTSRPIELEADAFSGFYMALDPNYSWTSIDNYFTAMASEGDYNFNDPSHHGTPQERLAAAQLGFQTAVQAVETQTQLTYADLHQIFSSAIGGFSARHIPMPDAQDSAANRILVGLDSSEIIDILNGVNHGKDASVPDIGDRRHLYPRK
jgi:hypothetical protein